MPSFFLFPFLLIALYATAQDRSYSTEIIAPNLVENANAVVRLDDMTIEILSSKQLTLRRKRAITVLDEKGDKHAIAYVSYDEGLKVKNIQARIYDADGRELHKIKEKEFKDISAVDGSTLYSDSRYKYYRHIPIQYPYTIELSYELTTRNTGEIPASWLFVNDFQVSTEKSRLDISFTSPELRPELKEKNLSNIDISIKKTDNSIAYEALNIAAIKAESMAPSFRQLAPQVLIRPVNFYYEGYPATINSWNDLGLWMHGNLLHDRDELTPATRSHAMALVKGVDDDLEKARIIYEYVQQSTRYISVQVGIGGIQPISAIEVDRLKYGDCKGLSNYTKALLKAVDVTAYYVHVEAGKNKIDFEQDFPNLAQGNHVILAIPYNDEYYWIDCTSQVHPFGFIGDFTDDRKVLVIKPDGGEIVSTQSYIDDENYQSTKGSYALQEDGSLTGEVIIHTKGIQYDHHFGLQERPKDDIKKYYQNYWGHINNLNVKAYQFKNDMSSVVFTEQVSVDAANYASKSGTHLLFAANAFNKNTYIPKRYRNRKLPFEIQRGFLDEDEFTIEIPKGYEVEAVPPAIAIANKFGSYAIEFEENQKKIVLKRTFSVKQGAYPNTEYADYRSFLKTVSKHDNAKIIIKSTL